MKITKKLIAQTLRSQNRTEIYKLCYKLGIDVKKRKNVYDFIVENAPSKKVELKAYNLTYGNDRVYCGSSNKTKEPIRYAIAFAKQQEIESNYCKILVKGNTNYYWAHPQYQHSDYNKTKAFPINEKNDKLAYLLNNLIEKSIV